MQAVKETKFIDTVRVDKKISDLSETEKSSLVKTFLTLLSSLIIRTKPFENDNSELERYHRKVLTQRSASESAVRMFMITR